MKKPRAALLIIDRRRAEIVLIGRRREGAVYSTLPGGKIEPGETPAAAAAREAREETGLQVEVGGEVACFENLGRLEHYFLALGFHGSLSLGGPEAQKLSPSNFYAPEWVALDRLEEVNLLPVQIRAVCRTCAAQACANPENDLSWRVSG